MPVDLADLAVAPIPRDERVGSIDDLVAAPGIAPQEWQSASPASLFASFTRFSPVQESADLNRIMALPRRPRVEPGTPRAAVMIRHVTAKYSKNVAPGSCRCKQIAVEREVIGKPCITELNYAQAWALQEIELHGGLLANCAVGSGKTCLDVLAPMALESHDPKVRLCLLLVPPTLVQQLVTEYLLLDQHFRVPSLRVHGQAGKADRAGAPTLHVLPYSRLSRPESTVFLEELEPDAIISDECHSLSSVSSVRTGRFLRYFYNHGDTKFCGWSGSVTDDSLNDYAHLAALALQYGSPLPLDKEVLDEWARAIDPSDAPAPPGALLRLCQPGEHVQEAFHRRLVETPGFVATMGASIDAEMEISERVPPPVPDVPREDPRSPGVTHPDTRAVISEPGWWPGVASCLNFLRETWTRPDGEELVDALSVGRCARELACGLFLRWKWTHGETEEQVKEWLEARKLWRKELRKKIARGEPHLDSPMLCANAAMRAWGHVPKGDQVDVDEDGEAVAALVDDAAAKRPEWRAATWPRWHAVKDLVKPETEAVRIDDYLARDAARWGRENLGIIWYATVAFGSWVSELSGLPLHAGGPTAAKKLAKEDGTRSIVASIKSHGTGRDGLQRIFATQLVAQPPSSGAAWEQLLGRLSRIGQEAQVIRAQLYRHTPELQKHVDDALRKALYVQTTTGSHQKLRAGWKIVD